METEQLYARYRELQSYVGWAENDAERIVAAAPLVRPFLDEMIVDFYEEIERHPRARQVVTGGWRQIERLKVTLRAWLEDLLTGAYDRAYVERRWRVGWRHVEIGLDQVYTNVALSRLRVGLVRALHERWTGDPCALKATVRSFNKLLDLDLAIIEDAYQHEYALRLQRGERLAALGRVAGGVAHELRNPLNAIQTSAYYLIHADDAPAEKRADHLQRIKRNVELAGAVITALSNFARMPVPDARPIALAPLVCDVLELNPPRAGVEIVLGPLSELPPVLGDCDQLRIVVANLVRNAYDAMPEGGRLSVSGRAGEGRVELSIADDGTGIEADVLARIMEPLFTTKPRGLGLGLAIARAIVEKNQGDLSVSSVLGEGSVFTVQLIAAPDGRAPA